MRALVHLQDMLTRSCSAKQCARGNEPALCDRSLCSLSHSSPCVRPHYLTALQSLCQPHSYSISSVPILLWRRHIHVGHIHRASRDLPPSARSCARAPMVMPCACMRAAQVGPSTVYMLMHMHMHTLHVHMHVHMHMHVPHAPARNLEIRPVPPPPPDLDRRPEGSRSRAHLRGRPGRVG